MGFGGTLDWFITVALVVIAILCFIGKGDFLIVGTKGQNKNVQKEFDIKKLSFATGCICAALAVMQFLVSLLGETYDILVYIYIPYIIIVFVIGIIYIKKKCKKTK